MTATETVVWHKVAELDELADGRVMTVIVGRTQPRAHPLRRPLRRARQPLPAPGRSARRGLDREGLAALPVARLRLRPAHRHAAARVHRRARALPGRGARRRRLRRARRPSTTAAAHRLRRHGRDDGAPGASPTCSAWSATRTSASPTRCARPRRRGDLTFIGIRHEGAAAFAAVGLRQAHRSAGGVLRDRRAGLDQPAHRPLRRQGRPGAGARDLAGRCRRRCSAGARSRTSTSPPRSPTSPVYSQTVLRDSDHVELMTLACKHALVQRGVAHLVLPDEVQVLPAPATARARPPERAASPTATIAPAATRGRAGRRAARGRRAPGASCVGHGARFDMDDVVAPRRALDAPVLTTFKAKGIVADHHPLACGVLGRSGTPVASLAHERVRPAGRVRRVVREPHRHRVVQADHPGRLRARCARPLPPGHRAGARPRRRDRAPSARRAATVADVQTVDQRADVAARWAIWRAEKERRLGRRPRPRCRVGRAVRRARRGTFPTNAVIAVDVGNNTYSFGRYFECKPASPC